MSRVQKTYEVPYFKALGSDGGPGEGLFEAIVSVFNNVDLVGDRVKPGAFTMSLERWKASGAPIPVIFSHRWDDLDAHIGEVLEARELFPGNPELPERLKAFGGLLIKGRLDVDDDLAARKVYRLLKRRRIREFSFAYDVIDSAEAEDGATDLLELDLFEVGPTLKGANPLTELIGAKAEPAHARVNGRDVVRFPSKADEDEAEAKADEDKVEKADANYRLADTDAESTCSACRHYTGATDSGTCALVEGRIDPTFTSDLFEARDEAEPDENPVDGASSANATTVGASSLTLAVTTGAKRGRTLSAKNEQALRDAVKLIENVLQQVTSDDDGKGAREDTRADKAEAPTGKAEDRDELTSTRLRLAAELEALEAPIVGGD